MMISWKITVWLVVLVATTTTTTRNTSRHNVVHGFTLPLGSSSISMTRTRILMSTTTSTKSDEELLDEKLYNIARRLKLEVFDLDEGVFGFDSQDPLYGLKVVQTEISCKADEGLGLILTEIAHGQSDDRGLVLVSAVEGNAARATVPILVGDVITGVRTSDGSFQARTTGLNYDGTVEAISEAKQHAAAAAANYDRDYVLHLELNRLVNRARIQVEIVDEKGDVTMVETLAGENLRRLLLRKGVQLYDRRTKRFDMPFATGDCGGEGICGTCLVNVLQGIDQCNPKDDLEKLITKGRPVSWRASCRTVVGVDNKSATIRIAMKPQSRYSEELDPGVRSVDMGE